jgi:hypothetical protein
MTKSSLSSLMVAISLGVSAPLLLSGCSDASTESPAERTGSVSAAITTVGADGATYSFPVGAYAFLQGPEFGEYFPLSDGGTALSVDLPVGTYTLSLYYASGGIQLERTVDGVTSVIDATWTDPAPLVFTIEDGATTPIVLHFGVETLGDVTFDTGNLGLTFDVIEEEAEEASQLDEGGTFTFTDSTFLDPSADYASALAVELGVPYAQRLDIQSQGDWRFVASYGICKEGSLQSTGYEATPEFARRIQQLSGSGTTYSQICVYDYGASDLVTFYTSRSGEAPIEQQSFLTEPTYQFVVYAGGNVGDVFDGKTLKQAELASAKVSSGFFSNYVYDSGNDLIVSATGVFEGTIEFGN